MTRAQYLNDALSRAGLTQKELSDKSGVPAGTLSKVFAGTYGASLNVDQLVRLSVALDFSLDEYASAVHGVPPRVISISDQGGAAMLMQVQGWLKHEVGKYADVPESFWDKIKDGVLNIFQNASKDRLLYMHMRREIYHNVIHVLSFFLILASFFYFYYDATRHNFGLIQYDIATTKPAVTAPISTPLPTPPPDSTNEPLPTISDVK